MGIEGEARAARLCVSVCLSACMSAGLGRGPGREPSDAETARGCRSNTERNAWRRHTYTHDTANVPPPLPPERTIAVYWGHSEYWEHRERTPTIAVCFYRSQEVFPYLVRLTPSRGWGTFTTLHRVYELAAPPAIRRAGRRFNKTVWDDRSKAVSRAGQGRAGQGRALGRMSVATSSRRGTRADPEPDYRGVPQALLSDT